VVLESQSGEHPQLRAQLQHTGHQHSHGDGVGLGLFVGKQGGDAPQCNQATDIEERGGQGRHAEMRQRLKGGRDLGRQAHEQHIGHHQRGQPHQ